MAEIKNPSLFRNPPVAVAVERQEGEGEKEKPLIEVAPEDEAETSTNDTVLNVHHDGEHASAKNHN